MYFASALPFSQVCNDLTLRGIRWCCLLCILSSDSTGLRSLQVQGTIKSIQPLNDGSGNAIYQVATDAGYPTSEQHGTHQQRVSALSEWGSTDWGPLDQA